jgi:FKBP-type peptidyl-prolyl cis-trans isomerase
MKTTKILIGVALIAGLALSSCMGNQKSVKLVTEEDSVSYALGLSAGTGYAQNLKDFPGEVNKEALIEGFIKGMKEDTANFRIRQDDLYPFLQSYFTRAAEREREKTELENVKILYENRQKEGVKVTESGLQYRVITEGKGRTPVREDVVRVHYTGRLADGTVFDSSVERGQPTEFPVGAVIPGWTEALMMMPVGSKWELVIPSELGYGERQAGPIPANSILFFEVDLLDIVPSKK